MIIMKFGGTSVGSAERIAATTDLVKASSKPAVVVLSAMSGITNKLLEVADGKRDIAEIAELHKRAAAELSLDESLNVRIDEILASASTHDEIVACGELLSSTLVQAYMRRQGIDAVWVSALDFMKIDRKGDPDTEFICEHVAATLDNAGRHDVYVTQGFICRDSDKLISTLTRGGSDYTATLLGEALCADEVQIWTDVDGVYTADPRYVKGAHCIPEMSFAQADRAARCGAKILHPECILPAQRARIPVRVLDSFHPERYGTKIGDIADAEGFIAVAYDGKHVNLIGHDCNVTTDDIAGAAVSDDIKTHEDYISLSAGSENAYEIMQTLHDKYVK